MHSCSSTYHCWSTLLYLIILYSDLWLFSRPESYSSKVDKNPSTGKPLDIGITGLEAHGSAKKSEGFFAKGVLKAMESSNVADNVHEVKVIGNGHCHGVTFFCLLLWHQLYIFLQWLRIVDGLMESGFALAEEGKYPEFFFLFLICCWPRIIVHILVTVELGLTEDSEFMISRTLVRLLELTNERRRTIF